MKKELEPFYRSLKRRGLNQARLAALAVDDFGYAMNRSVLARVLGCRPGECGTEGKERGRLSRQRLFPHLTGAELEMLGWMEEYRAWREAKSQSLLTSAATGNKGVEHSSTGNRAGESQMENGREQMVGGGGVGGVNV